MLTGAKPVGSHEARWKQEGRRRGQGKRTTCIRLPWTLCIPSMILVWPRDLPT